MKPRAGKLAVTAVMAMLSGLLLPAFCHAAETNLVLHTKTFKLDPNKFYIALQAFSTIQFGTISNSPSAKTFSTNFGTVDIHEDKPGRHLRYSIGGIDSENDTRLDVANELNRLGVNLAPPKGLAFNEREMTLTVRAAESDLDFIEQVIKTWNTVPPEVTMKARFVGITDDDIFTPEFDWFLKMMASNGTNGLTSIITEPLLKTLLKKIEDRKSASLFNEEEVTTLSGRQANFQVIEIATNQATVSGDQSTNNPVSKVVDVVPYVLADGYTIQLTIIPTITERTEYAKAFVSTIQSGNGHIPISGPLPLPHTRVRQIVVNRTVWDGQTVVVLLGPYVPHQTNVAVFVTPTIIDASGNRMNSEESLNFAQKAIPRQSAQ